MIYYIAELVRHNNTFVTRIMDEKTRNPYSMVNVGGYITSSVRYSTHKFFNFSRITARIRTRSYESNPKYSRFLEDVFTNKHGLDIWKYLAVITTCKMLPANRPSPVPRSSFELRQTGSTNPKHIYILNAAILAELASHNIYPYYYARVKMGLRVIVPENVKALHKSIPRLAKILDMNIPGLELPEEDAQEQLPLKDKKRSRSSDPVIERIRELEQILNRHMFSQEPRSPVQLESIQPPTQMTDEEIRAFNEGANEQVAVEMPQPLTGPDIPRDYFDLSTSQVQHPPGY